MISNDNISILHTIRHSIVFRTFYLRFANFIYDAMVMSKLNQNLIN